MRVAMAAAISLALVGNLSEVFVDADPLRVDANFSTIAEVGDIAGDAKGSVGDSAEGMAGGGRWLLAAHRPRRGLYTELVRPSPLGEGEDGRRPDELDAAHGCSASRAREKGRRLDRKTPHPTLVCSAGLGSAKAVAGPGQTDNPRVA